MHLWPPAEKEHVLSVQFLGSQQDASTSRKKKRKQVGWGYSCLHSCQSAHWTWLFPAEVRLGCVDSCKSLSLFHLFAMISLGYCFRVYGGCLFGSICDVLDLSFVSFVYLWQLATRIMTVTIMMISAVQQKKKKCFFSQQIPLVWKRRIEEFELRQVTHWQSIYKKKLPPDIQDVLLDALAGCRVNLFEDFGYWKEDHLWAIRKLFFLGALG